MKHVYTENNKITGYYLNQKKKEMSIAIGLHAGYWI